MELLEFTVVVVALVDDEQLDEDDIGVAGEYDFALPAYAAQWTSSAQAKAILDEFHDSVAIGVLDDFEISVLDGNGNEIWEEFEDEVAASPCPSIQG